MCSVCLTSISELTATRALTWMLAPALMASAIHTSPKSLQQSRAFLGGTGHWDGGRLKPSKRHPSACLARLFVLPSFWLPRLPRLPSTAPLHCSPLLYLLPNCLRQGAQDLEFTWLAVGRYTPKICTETAMAAAQIGLTGERFGVKQRERAADGQCGLT